MYHKKSEKGQALVIIALAAVGLFAFTALAIDGSRVFSDRRHAQNAADTSALAAALAKIRTPDYPPNAPGAPNLAAIAAGEERAKSNGYVTDVTDADPTVEVRFCDEVLSLSLTPPCEGLPTSADTPEEQAEYIQVVIKLTTKTTFARIIGRREVPSIVTAIARAKPGLPAPPGGGAAISAMDPDDEKAVWGNGNFELIIHNSGIFDNSGHGCAFVTSGAAGSYTVDTGFEVVGGYCPSGPITLNPAGSLHVGVPPRPYPPTYNIPTPSISCGTQPSVWDPITSTFSPGNHINLDIPHGIVTFADGNHCFSGGVNIHGNTSIVANNVNFLVTSGEFFINSNGSFSCSNALFHFNGGTGFRVNGTSTNICNGVTFFMSTGDLDWDGNPTIDFKAPASGDYPGLLIYLPFENKSPLTINGNSQQSLTGSIIAAGSEISINGNSGTFALSSQIIGGTVKLGGQGKIEINYDPAQQYALADPHAIQLVE